MKKKIEIKDLEVGMIIENEGNKYLVGDVNKEGGVCACGSEIICSMQPIYFLNKIKL